MGVSFGSFVLCLSRPLRMVLKLVWFLNGISGRSVQALIRAAWSGRLSLANRGAVLFFA